MKKKKDEEIKVEENNTKIEELENKISSLEEENKILNDKVLGAGAELQNYRKRKDEEVERLLKYSEEDIILETISIIDNFERAIKLDDTNLNDELSKFLQGFKMIYTDMIGILNNHNVKEIEALDKEFDPQFHQAVLTNSITDKPNNIVLEVLQKGYIYKDKVIKPSMVIVNKIEEGEMKNE